MGSKCSRVLVIKICEQNSLRNKGWAPPEGKNGSNSPLSAMWKINETITTKHWMKTVYIARFLPNC